METYRFPSFEIEKIYRYMTDEELAQNSEAINDDLHAIYYENELHVQYPPWEN